MIEAAVYSLAVRDADLTCAQVTWLDILPARLLRAIAVHAIAMFVGANVAIVEVARRPPGASFAAARGPGTAAR